MKKKVLLIDSGYGDYIQNYFKECASQVDTTLITNYFAECGNNENIYKLFFKYSNNMSRSKARDIIRGLEYIYAYIKILKLINKVKYDVVHIQWALIPVVDYFFFRRIKKSNCRLVYTAHDVIPHINPGQLIESFRRIYSLPDKIIVHGRGCETEMLQFYPEVGDRLYIQNSGIFEKVDAVQDAFDQNNYLAKRIKRTNGRIFLFIGQIFYNKGADRILKYWLDNCIMSDDLLIVAGRVRETYCELENLLEDVAKSKNILYYPHYLPKELHDYLYSACDIIVLPYRHASMSGVFFSAAQFEKTVICTNEGSIAEYAGDNNNVYLCSNNGHEFEDKLEHVINNVSKEELRMQGKKFADSIYAHYGWETIIEGVVEYCYLDGKSDRN